MSHTSPPMWLLGRGWNCGTKVSLLWLSFLSSSESLDRHWKFYIPMELLWNHFAGGRRPVWTVSRCPFLYIYPQLLVWNIDSHVFMFTEKPAYQDPLEAPPPSCLLGSTERHSAVNPDLGVQPVSFPYGVCEDAAAGGREPQGPFILPCSLG